MEDNHLPTCGIHRGHLHLQSIGPSEHVQAPSVPYQRWFLMFGTFFSLRMQEYSTQYGIWAAGGFLSSQSWQNLMVSLLHCISCTKIKYTIYN